MPRRIAMLSLMVAMVWPPVLAHAATASIPVRRMAELCFGQTATITGTPGQNMLQGTAGPDVIVTNGADEVDAQGGDDLVCSTGRAPFYGRIVSLGPGADRLLGSSSDEVVYANDEAAGEVDRDTIDTGGGRDVVSTGSEVTGAGVSEDVVALGAGRDMLRVTGPVSAASLAGEQGRDEIFLWAELPRGLAVTIDNRDQELILGSEVLMKWSSFEHFTSLGIIKGPFTFRGTKAPERLGYEFFVGTRWKVDVRMGGGPDRVELTGGSPGSRFDGGPGADRIQNLSWEGPRARKGAVIYGRAGNDLLLGDNDRDTLMGGRGYDVAHGGNGFDRCKAEVRTDCEA